MPTYTHGGDIYGLTKPVLDFSANLHPLGMPSQVQQAAQQAVSAAVHYPDALCRELRKALADLEGIRPSQIICGCGAADLILRLCFAKKPQKALITAPTFSEYESALKAVDCQVQRYMLDPRGQFDVTEEILEHLHGELDMVFLCSPNNPTGRIIPHDLLQRIAQRCKEQGILLVLDECFLPFTTAKSMAGQLEEYPNLFLLRAFTKSYAIPGLRLGYGLCSDEALLELLYEVGQPWAVSTVAQAAGLAACQLPDYPQKGREVLEQERPFLISEMGKLGLTVFEGAANYLLFQAKGDTTLRERLVEQGVLIRSCANYPGLGPDYYRIAVRSREENQQLLGAMREVLSWQKQS